jgi:predicted PurR-regulated permease PerM
MDTGGEGTGTRRPVDTGVTPGVLVASTWAWRLLVTAAAAFALGWGLRYFSEVVVPVVVAVLLSALLVPVTTALQRLRLSRGPAAGLTVLGTIAVVAGLLTLVGTQLTTGFQDLSARVAEGIAQLRDLARVNFGLTDADIQNTLDKLKASASSSGLGARAAEVGTQATHFVAGLFIALFATFFFLYEGERIWDWLVRLMPRRARGRTDSSGRVAWHSLTSYVRATIIVALVDAIGISVGAWALGLPLVTAIGILVFVGAFVPVVGAFVSGLVAVLVGLVDQGVWVAVGMLAVVVAVQQLEAHVLQPFLLGRAVSVHPLAVILAIAAGVVVAGIVGALIAVPAAAVTNAVVHHLAGHDQPQPEPSPEPSLPPA